MTSHFSPDQPVPVILRARNDLPRISATLYALARQTRPYELIAFDNASTDGTREALVEAGATVHDVAEGSYIPGQVLNRAMEASTGDIVVFLNSDCTPCHPEWLETLVSVLEADASLAGVFGRQVPRPDCTPLYAADTERAFGDGSAHSRFGHFFSMASSAIRRSAWDALPFSETLRYSEDIDWSWRARQAGHEIGYVPKSVVEHSHNYTLGEWYRRQRGEGAAEAVIFLMTPWERSLVRYSLLPWCRAITRDIRTAWRRRSPGALWQSPWLRLAGTLGRRAGLREGLRMPPAEIPALQDRAHVGGVEQEPTRTSEPVA